LLDEVADGQFGVKVDTGIDPEHVMLGLQKIANRIATGLVLAALIIGAAMLMRIETSDAIDSTRSPHYLTNRLNNLAVR
jgi:hypothetical protein